ncbi:MAG: sulfotransferase domain-containing protein [Gemmatimonadota bacterium]
MTVLWWILGAAGALLALFLVMGVWLSMVLRWEDEATVGLGYYGRPLAGRERFRGRLTLHARLLAPLIALNSRLAKLDFRRARMQYRGVSAPLGSCSPGSFERAVTYIPSAGDVFVVTQMKCGTTWMQNVVYEILLRGRGELVDKGGAIYAVSPWLEGRRSVSVHDAPLVGTGRPTRIVKTHLPASLCPWSPAARYIYVARHPLSCFASCIDFVDTNVGAMAPPLPAFVEWFTSPDLMWWGTWTDHVRGWWDRSRTESGVLFIYFEDMKKDLGSVVTRVAAFLGVSPLSADEMAAVVRHCSFDYMQEHQSSFEMHPPHILQTNAELFVSGRADRHKDVPPDVRRRIAAWSMSEMQDSSFPLRDRYPDLVSTAGT